MLSYYVGQDSASRSPSQSNFAPLLHGKLSVQKLDAPALPVLDLPLTKLILNRLHLLAFPRGS